MAKLTFFYSVMNAGKSLNLLQANHNYKSKNLNTMLIKPSIETRFGTDHIGSRLGISEPALSISPLDNLEEIDTTGICAILIDEGQFLTESQVIQLSNIVDDLGIDVLVYGLKTNINGKLFEGSQALLVYADKILEIKQLCTLCLSKATMHIKLRNDVPCFETEIEIGKEDLYLSLCRKHYKFYKK